MVWYVMVWTLWLWTKRDTRRMPILIFFGFGFVFIQLAALAKKGAKSSRRAKKRPFAETLALDEMAPGNKGMASRQSKQSAAASALVAHAAASENPALPPCAPCRMCRHQRTGGWMWEAAPCVEAGLAKHAPVATAATPQGEGARSEDNGVHKRQRQRGQARGQMRLCPCRNP